MYDPFHSFHEIFSDSGEEVQMKEWKLNVWMLAEQEQVAYDRRDLHSLIGK